MSKKIARMLMPALRFPGFQDTEGWAAKPLNEIAKPCKQKNKLTELKRVLTNSAEFGVLDQRDFFDKDIANQNNLDGYYIVAKGDYVYNPRISKTAPVGPISKNNIGLGVMSPLYTVFRFNSNDNDFYAHYFNSTCWHHYMRQASSTGARHDRMAIASDDFMALPLPVISHAEQQKIADCLTSIETLINAQSQKVEALKSHKKSLMQQLFPCEGETTPRRRFPAFRGAGEWFSGLVNDLSTLVMGNAFKSEDFVENGIQLIRMGNLYQGEINLNRAPIFLPYTFEQDYAKFLIKPLDLLMSMTGTMGKQDYGFIVQVPQQSNVLLLNQRVVKITPKKGCINQFLLQLLKTEHFLDQLYSLPGGTKQANLSAGQLKEIEVKFPNTPEQQKIADCLTSLDTLITTQTQKLEALKTHKKGLMQALFPAPAEVEA